MANNIQGFVMIGAQAIVFSITNLRTLKTIERGRYPVAIGDDFYAEHEILPDTVDAIVQAFDAINQIFKDYGVPTVNVFASTSWAEADNAEFVRDQLYTRTGWLIKTTSLSEEAFFRTQAIMVKFPQFKSITQKGTVLIDISSGSVELTTFSNGVFGFSRNLSLGPLRVYEIMSDVQRSVTNYVEVMRDYIDSRLLDFMRLLPQGVEYTNMILMGSNLSIFQNIIPEGKHQVETDRPGFDLLYDEVTKASDQYLADTYDLTSDQTSLVLPTVLLVYRLVETLNSQSIWISDLKAIDGIEVNAAHEGGFKKLGFDPNEEIVISANNLAERYQVDEAHMQATRTVALQLFDRLKKLHGMGKRERLLLEVAATVSDIGSYIETHKHYAHSNYIIKASEIMGLNDLEVTMVATITRFHSSITPQSDLKNFPTMSTENRLVVAKLSALLRVADSLDASRQQKIQQLRVSVKPNEVLLTARADDDIELERWTLARKGKFFSEVFGLGIELKGRNIL
ncbi:Exopolyphosphatase [Lacticaseibacillus paracasei]|uniref:Ppx/GppA phosphatase family protein n=1 Tax=Lacticaseibacillus paracasei TaxID=1597 RepID=UPI000355486D|nr:exopolyphosphatase [Lacticaseibacillus paracasei]AGP69502.1 Exopolyphosphatase [Lacticaseibacillus paracasei]